MKKPKAIVIGAGFTGCAVGHDLALRGFDVIVVDRGEIACGTSGRTHGHLHSGARYSVVDPDAARECVDENRYLAQYASQCVEYNGGLFLLLDEADREYANQFAAGAERCGVPVNAISGREALELEPNINPKVIMAYKTLDGTFDPLRLALAFAATAKKNQVEFRTYHEMLGFVQDQGNNVTGIRVWDRLQDKKYSLEADIVINATGAWAGKIAEMAGLKVSITPTPGVMVAYDRRFVQRVVQHLAVPGDGDAILPQRRMVVMGTTSFVADEIEYIPVYEDHIRQMESAAALLVPQIRTAKQRGAYMSARPLIGNDAKGRSNSRTFICYNHKTLEGIEGLLTITGGKATTCRMMAEKTVDEACKNLGISAACSTRHYPLLSYREFYR